MEPKVINWDPQWGELTEDAMRQVLTQEGYQVSRYRYQPGTYYPPHGHGVDKKEAVVQGRLEIGWEGGSTILKPGQMLEIPAWFRHSARVKGTETVVSLDASRKAVPKATA